MADLILGILEKGISVVEMVVDAIDADASNRSELETMRKSMITLKGILRELLMRCDRLGAAAQQPLSELAVCLTEVQRKVNAYLLKGAGRYKQAVRLLTANSLQQELAQLQAALNERVTQLLLLANLSACSETINLQIEAVNGLAQDAVAKESALQQILEHSSNANARLEEIVELVSAASGGGGGGGSQTGWHGSAAAVEAMEDKHVQQVVALLQQQQNAHQLVAPAQAAAAWQHGSIQQSPSAFGSVAAASSVAAVSCAICFSSRPQDPVMLDTDSNAASGRNLQVDNNTYCFACITRWLRESSHSFSRAPAFLAGGKLPGMFVRLRDMRGCAWLGDARFSADYSTMVKDYERFWPLTNDAHTAAAAGKGRNGASPTSQGSFPFLPVAGIFGAAAGSGGLPAWPPAAAPWPSAGFGAAAAAGGSPAAAKPGFYTMFDDPEDPVPGTAAGMPLPPSKRARCGTRVMIRVAVVCAILIAAGIAAAIIVPKLVNKSDGRSDAEKRAANECLLFNEGCSPPPAPAGAGANAADGSGGTADSSGAPPVSAAGAAPDVAPAQPAPPPAPPPITIRIYARCCGYARPGDEGNWLTTCWQGDLYNSARELALNETGCAVDKFDTTGIPSARLNNTVWKCQGIPADAEVRTPVVAVLQEVCPSGQACNKCDDPFNPDDPSLSNRECCVLPPLRT